MKVVSKAQLAGILEISKPRVSQYVARGLPVRPDGKIDYPAAVKWIAENVVPINPATADKGASRAARLTRKAAAKKAPEPAPAGASDADISDLLGAILNRAGPAIAEAVVAAGADLVVAFAAVHIVRAGLSVVATAVLEEFGHLVGSDNEPDGLCWSGLHGEPREPDWSALADRTGDVVDLDAWRCAEAALPYYSDDGWFPAQPGLATE